MKVLVVMREFADYVKGAIIKAEDEIEKILGSHHAAHVEAAEHPDEQAPSAPGQAKE